MNEMTKFDAPIKLSKHEARVIQWLLVATTETRPALALEGVNVGDEQLVTGDGFRLHTTDANEIPPLYASKGKTMTFTTVPLVSECYVGIQETQSPNKFPDHSFVLERARENEVAIEIGVNPKFLIEALRNLDDNKSVRLVFYDPAQAFEVNGTIKTGEEETKVQALIMPMYLGSGINAMDDD